ncbi:hypothetical protein ACFPVX_18520 [Cohnella faecalis]|uniref:hypothetical protein n=1 Tax=Cohnella faecalis TaxID=2315694 RepID=UPI0011C2141A|nr:hypothetical protein [Cohnella faecalis]
MRHVRAFQRLPFLFFLLCAFFVFNMPTMMIGDPVATSNSSALVHDMPNSVKATKRTSPTPAGKLLWISALLASLFRFFSYPLFRMTAPPLAFLPSFFLHNLKRMLMPLKFTTSYIPV